MAFMRDYTVYSTTGGTAATEHELISEMNLTTEENDIIALLINIDSTKSCTVDGFTAKFNQTGNACRQYLFWKRVGSGEENMAIPNAVLSGSDNMSAIAWSVVGCPTTGDPMGVLGATNTQTASSPKFKSITGMDQYSIVFSMGTSDKRPFQSDARYQIKDTKMVTTVSSAVSGGESVHGFLGSTFIHETGMTIEEDNHALTASDGVHTRRVEFLDANSQDSNIAPRIPTYVLDTPVKTISAQTAIASEIADSSWKAWMETGQQIDGNSSRTAYTFSSSDVDFANDKITLAIDEFDHRRIFKFTTTGTAPAGITDDYYYFNKVSDTEVKLRSAQNNGVYGNASNITITDAGTGTHTLTDFGIMRQGMGSDLDFDQLASGHNVERNYVGTFWQFNNPQDFDSSKETIITGHKPELNGYRSLVFIIMDSSNNWKSFEMGAGLKNASAMSIRVVDPASPQALASDGTLDLTAIEYYGWFYKTTARNKRPRIVTQKFKYFKPVEMLGGDSTDPMSSSSIVNELGFWTQTMGTSVTSKVTDLQATTRVNLKIGDGTNSVYFKDTEKSFCWNALANNTTEFTHYLPPLYVDVNLTATDTFELKNCTLGASREFDFELTGSSSATVDLDGSYLIGGDGKFRSTDTIDGVTFQGGTGFVDHNNATVTNCTFDNIGRSAGYIKMTSSHNISDSTIKTNTASDYAIEIDTAGTYDFDNLSFDGFTASLNPTLTSGTVTINTLNGGDTATLDGTWTDNGNGNFTKGSATVVIQNTVALTVGAKDAATGSAIQGARVLLLAGAGGSLTEGTQILTGVTDVNGEVSTSSFNFTSDQPVTGRIRKSSSSPFYKTGLVAGTITSSGLDVSTFLVGDE